jgi:hypothetical protein
MHMQRLVMALIRAHIPFEMICSPRSHLQFTVADADERDLLEVIRRTR